MQAQQQPAELLGAIEEALALRKPFADSEYIFDQLQVSLKGRLGTISRHLPAAGDLLEAINQANVPLPRVLGNTVVRCAIIHAHSHLEANATYGLPLADCKEVFEATLRYLQDGNTDTPLNDGSLRRLGPEPYHGWIWNDEHPNDIFGRSFRYLLKDRYAAIPVTPSEDEIRLLQAGARLLQELMPVLTPATLPHAQMLTLVPSEGGWKGCASSSQFHLGSTIFLGRNLHTPWWVAEHLLHEALHQKLYDFRQSHSLLEFDYARAEAPRVVSPWNSEQLNKSNRWDAHRVYAAYHVYVHLALLGIVAEQRAAELESTYGPLHAMMESRKALERAHYLGEKLKEECWDELGPAGKSMAEWLFTVMDILDPNPPPKGAFIHLCLDLYETENNRVVSALKDKEPAAASFQKKLAPLAIAEWQSARQLLSIIGAQQEIDRLDTALNQFTDDELGKGFPQVRRIIGSALMNAAFNRYRLTGTGEQDELLRSMIEKASRPVHSLLAGYSPAVGDAKRRANELRFNMSCDDNVGRILAMLAASVPSGGRILEIGTGVGVGTAWIMEGLDDRTDVEVISLEVQPALANATREWPWPSYVQIVVCDALRTIGSIGTFDLVFADASPLKYGRIDTVLPSIRPGGILIVDDLGEPSTSEQQRMDKNALRSVLTQHPDLHAVDMQWSTGVVLATKAIRASRLAAEIPVSYANAGIIGDPPIRLYDGSLYHP
ncbi:MAG TPA: HEXXH motif-containing putative peptide modification protein [Puia sp.]|jgi:predicted O-methyltransferase YrrM|nr:HEXXH motif-containing putative peptide modification protein [Puia sp.]